MCHAQLKLYKSLETLQQRVLYFDTAKPSQPDIPPRDYLGDVTNKLDDGDFITEFTSAGRLWVKSPANSEDSPSMYEDRGNSTIMSFVKT